MSLCCFGLCIPIYQLVPVAGVILYKLYDMCIACTLRTTLKNKEVSSCNCNNDSNSNPDKAGVKGGPSTIARTPSQNKAVLDGSASEAIEPKRRRQPHSEPNDVD